MTRSGIALLAVLISLSVHAAEPSPAPEGASVYFITPINGQQVSSPVKIRFGLKGMGVAPAGVERQYTGHHHLLINMDSLPPLDQPLPATKQIVHFGGGQTETSIELPAGEHRLKLLLGDHFHIPHSPPVLSETITINVQ